MMWMIARYDPEDSDALVIAVKGGHNGEMHNQNDVGNIIVHLNGESVIPDIGRGRYTRAYFGPERYEHLVNSSRGHSVPLVNEQEQLPGKVHRCQLLEHRADPASDLLSLELKEAYPEEAGLAALRRTVLLHREPPRGWVELTDEFRFSSPPHTFESVLTTFSAVKTAASSVLLRGDRGALRVSFDAPLSVRVEEHEAVDLAEGLRDVRRVVFTFRETHEAGVIRLRIEPA